MTAFSWFSAGSPISDPDNDYEGGLMWDKAFRGFLPVSGPDIRYPFPPDMEPGPFPLAGDPATGTGHLDGAGKLWSFAPGDRKMVMSCGPFQMAPGDTQQVVYCFVAGQGADRLDSITEMRKNDSYAQTAFDNLFDRINQTDVEGDGDDKSGIPLAFRLFQNHPNPFNPETRIAFHLSTSERAVIRVFDMMGREIATLLDQNMTTGAHHVSWNGQDGSGREVGSGVYFYRLEAGSYTATAKMVLMR